MMRIDTAYRVLAKRFEAAGLETASLDARLLVCAAAGCDWETLVGRPETRLDAEAEARLAAMAERRLGHEPVSRILGHREFWGLPFSVTPDVLDPRADTETLIDLALDLARVRADGWPRRILDLGTGSGCLVAALLHEFDKAVGVGIDASARALRVAQANCASLGLTGRVTLQSGNWLEGIEARFDLIVSNPPYIPSADIDGLPTDVRSFDPRSALDGGQDGLDAYRAIARNAKQALEPQGVVLVEVGIDQADAVRQLFADQGFGALGARADLGGIERALAFAAV